MSRCGMKTWISRLWIALYMVRCELAGRQWFVQFDGRVWSVIED